MKIISVVGARPNFMKIAPLARVLKKEQGIKHVIVHTGQHYDYKMSQSFFKELGIPKPDINLGVGSGSHAGQTAEIIRLFEKILLKVKPDVVVVVGDVNSTLACSIVATKLRIPVAHIEAGLRSRDRDMPEEINRLVTDSVSDVLFTTSRDADRNLIKEGVPKSRIFFVGNVMIDTLKHNLVKAKKSKILNEMKLMTKRYALITLHRPANVDTKKNFMEIFSAIQAIQKKIKVVFPIHPRTRKNIRKFVSVKRLKAMKNLVLLDPLGYFDFLQLMRNAAFVLTDSGGIQEETTVLKVPCLTARKNTERPVTITQGSNILVGVTRKRIISESMKIIRGRGKSGRVPEKWDGRASERIVRKLKALHKAKRLLQ